VIDTAKLHKALQFASKEEKIQIEELIAAYEIQETRAKAQKSFLPFVEYIWPEFTHIIP